MPITNNNYTVPNNFVQQYNLGQKKIRADLVDENFTDVADVINDLIDDDELTVHTNDDQTISGDKTFTGDVNLAGDVSITGNLDVSTITSDLIDQLKVGILQQVFPVGSIYTTTNSMNPATLFGFGTWAQIEGRFIVGVSGSYAVTSTGGEATHKLTVNETPAHTHTRGTMNITGTFNGNQLYDIYNSTASATGAFAIGGASSKKTPGGTGDDSQSGFNFNASRSWTGVTSSVGGGAAHNNMPPYYAAYIWRRTA